MAGYLVSDARKVTTHRLMEMKEKTSYDFTTARIVDEAGMDVILVGDSASNVMAGNATTLPITVDQMIYHARSVVRGVNRALVVVDMRSGYAFRLLSGRPVRRCAQRDADDEGDGG